MRADRVINSISSQTRRTSDNIFLPVESTRLARLEVLRVLGLRPFILKTFVQLAAVNDEEQTETRQTARTRRSSDRGDVQPTTSSFLCKKTFEITLK